MKIETPDTSHLRQPQYQEVYEPAEDSYLLLDALEQELALLPQPQIVVEIGCGSGIISSAICSCFPFATVIATDLNPSACEATLVTAKNNKNVNLEVVKTDFLTCLSDQIKGKVDILVCNPPYVATDTSELGSQGIAASWAGGNLGLHLTRRIVEKLHEILSSDGVSYLVLEQCNKPDQFVEEVKQKYKMNCEYVIRRRAGREFLSVIKVTR